MELLDTTLDSYEADIIAISETHHKELPRELEGYNFHGKFSTSTHNSGTGIFFKKDKCATENWELTHPDLETNARITAITYNNTAVIEAYAP